MGKNTDHTEKAEEYPQQIEKKQNTKNQNLSKSDLIGILATTLEMLKSQGTVIVATDNKGFVNGALRDGLWLFIPDWSKNDFIQEDE